MTTSVRIKHVTASHESGISIVTARRTASAGTSNAVHHADKGHHCGRCSCRARYGSLAARSSSIRAEICFSRCESAVGSPGPGAGDAAILRPLTQQWMTADQPPRRIVPGFYDTDTSAPSRRPTAGALALAVYLALDVRRFQWSHYGEARFACSTRSA
jgi:hypothetical protein